MLEIRYNKTTYRVSGWCGRERSFGNLQDREGEEIVIIDMGVPPKALEAYLYDTTGECLIDNSAYVEPKPPRDLLVEIDDLKARLTALEPKEV